MRIGFVTARPDHPLLAGVRDLLSPRHEIGWLDPARDDAPDAAGPLADVYLLKARTPAALALASRLEERGAPVLNTAAATRLCQDRVAMARLAETAGLPFAETTAESRLAGLVAGPAPTYPLVVKSGHSRRGDLVARADGPGDLGALLTVWGDEPVVVQPFTPNSGWDHKLWVIGGRVFAALRRSELVTPAPAGPRPRAAVAAQIQGRPLQDAPPQDRPLRPDDLPAGWSEMALRVGEAFSLDVYGVDIIDAGGGNPRVVDVNAFPGARGQAGAPGALAALALRAGQEGAGSGRGWRHGAAGTRAAAGVLPATGPGAAAKAPPIAGAVATTVRAERDVPDPSTAPDGTGGPPPTMAE